MSLDGKLVDATEARLSPFDRGLTVGDGVFETFRAYAGAVPDLDRHLARLRRSADLTGLAPPPDDVAARVADVLAANGLAGENAADASVRVTLTAGPGGAGVSRRGAGPPTVLVTALPVAYPASAYDGVAAVVARTVRKPPPESLDPRVKSLNYMPAVLARREAEARGAFEAIVLNLAGDVCEATTANVFCVVDGEVVTPPLSSGCLDGLTRERVLDLARRDRYAVDERRLAVGDLARADEIFLTASVAEVLPVTTFEGENVGVVRPGPVARRLRKAYRESMLRAAGRA